MGTPAADVIVLGLGAVGSAVAFRLAERGRAVLGFDRFAPPHDRGSTHGETRITRLAIGEGPEYVPLVQRAHELWPEIEQATGTRLMQRTGGLVLGSADSPFLARTRATARAFAIPHENLDAAELRRRFPMFCVAEETEAYLEPAAGVLRPEAAVAAQLRLAERHGARLYKDERVLGWSADDAGVSVTTARGRHFAERLVVCAGPWTRELVPELSPLLAVQRQCLFWFPVERGYAELARMPIYIWEFGGARPDFAHGVGLYGFPALDGPAGGVKVGTETERAVPSPERAEPVSDAEAARMAADFVAPRMPWLGSRPLRTATCFYTSTREGRFIVDHHPEHANVTVVSACSGHGFKHSAAVGEAVADTVTGASPRVDLSPFALARHVHAAVDRAASR